MTTDEKTPDLAPTKNRKIRASVLHAARDVRLESRSLFPPSATDLQIRIAYTGLCGSDLHYYNLFRNGDILVQEPLSLGHESSGVVVAVGSDVQDKWTVGDKVALEVGLPCRVCERCKEGRYNICKDMKFRSSARGFPHAQGTLQDVINHPAEWCHKCRLPDDVPLEMGALLEPLSVAIHASKRAQLAAGATVLVFGAGAVGLLVAGVAKISGAETVVIADIDKGRVRFAVQNRFAHKAVVVPTRKGTSIDDELAIAKDTAAEAGKVGSSNGQPVGEFDAVFECTGVPSCLQAAIYATRPGGKVMLIGMGTPVQTLPISVAALREVDLIGVFRYANAYPVGVQVVSNRSPEYPDFSKLITHRFTGLESVPAAFEMAGRTKDEQGTLVIKVVVENGEEKRPML
ncbi:sorbitol dehydrogenase-like protein [Sporormia fimetaria CBS 119925]|uniref:Sorbitol dehydrogenase-like protein n=1 Tax=Sporormia fimetaria CBS 119925 TaxID=1340428 RepID=A0A6A6VHZ4_9PLEO|nr:sorbitol dehydrogenase-like protein [Sporormia fimetaria CBS 119925]